MKKLLVIMTALAMTFTFAAGAYALNQVQVTLTSPTIVKKGCEKAGSVTFAFDGSTTITAGDYWYMDLPTNVTICKPFDYMITGPAAAGDNIDITGGTSATLFSAPGLAIPAMVPGTAVGALTYSTVSGAPANLIVGGPIAFRVVGSGRRVTITAYGSAVGDSITVAPSHKLSIAILNGNMQNAGNPAAAAAYPAFMLLDTPLVAATAGDGIYGNTNVTATSDLLAGPLPDVNNTLCINAESFTQDLVFVSFASLNDIYTFTGDSQIAHVGAAAQLALASCKGDITGFIPIGGQGLCTFDYELPAGYCPLPATFAGNRILIQGSTTFGNVGDRYGMTVTSDTAGVYFGGAPVLGGYIPTDTTQCTGLGTGIAAAFTPETATTKVGVTYPASCVFTSLNRVVKAATVAGGIAGIDTFDRIWVNLPTMYYDSSIVGNGVEAKVTVSMSKYPCGDFFSGTRTVGTFVTTCPVGAGGTTLMYPFLPALDGSVPGWWGGFTVNNASATAGKVDLVFWEMDGDKATYSVASLASGGMWTMTSAELLAAVTPDPANVGTFGDSNVMITVTCAFNQGGGFAFTGNGNEGTGYTAYVLGAGGWQ